MVTIDNVLETKREDLENLSTDELEKLLHEVNDKADEFGTLQQANKILINSLYGAQGNKGFILFNEKIAQAITGNGRFFIQLLANNINNVLSKKLGKEFPFVFYGDTDSCTESTIVYLQNKQIKIKDLYDLPGTIIQKLDTGAEIKRLDETLYALSMNKNKQLEFKAIKYVMRHKTKKRMFRIKTKNNYVDITEDHSVMVLRNDRLISVKPNYILPNDRIYEI